MKKSDILKKISEQVARGILNPEAGEPVGLKITKQALGKSKKENDDYYKSLDKKFTDYLKMGGKDEPSPKVNMTDEERKMYYGTGMEGLKYDDEGTPKYEKFVKRNEELNKPSKDYYLDKDEVDDSYDRIMKDGKAYKKHKYEKPDEYQKTPKVRVTKESVNKKTMKQLNFKKPFLTQERVMKLIPESFKVDGNKFKMCDGVETYTIKWEGNTKTGTPTPLQYKNGTLIKEDVSKMKHLYDYNSQDTLMKTNDALTENQIFGELLGKSRLLKEQDATTTPTGTTPAPKTPTDGKKTGAAVGSVIAGVTFKLPKIKTEQDLSTFINWSPDVLAGVKKLVGEGRAFQYPIKEDGTGVGNKLVSSLTNLLKLHALLGVVKPYNNLDSLLSWTPPTASYDKDTLDSIKSTQANVKNGFEFVKKYPGDLKSYLKVYGDELKSKI